MILEMLKTWVETQIVEIWLPCGVHALLWASDSLFAPLPGCRVLAWGARLPSWPRWRGSLCSPSSTHGDTHKLLYLGLGIGPIFKWQLPANFQYLMYHET